MRLITNPMGELHRFLDAYIYDVIDHQMVYYKKDSFTQIFPGCMHSCSKQDSWITDLTDNLLGTSVLAHAPSPYCFATMGFLGGGLFGSFYLLVHTYLLYTKKWDRQHIKQLDDIAFVVSHIGLQSCAMLSAVPKIFFRCSDIVRSSLYLGAIFVLQHYQAPKHLQRCGKKDL